MILTCPSCATRYMVDATALGEGGRTVKCVRCDHRWHQTPVEEAAPDAEAEVEAAAPESEPETAPEPAPEAESAPPAAADAEAGADAPSEALESVAASVSDATGAEAIESTVAAAEPEPDAGDMATVGIPPATAATPAADAARPAAAAGRSWLWLGWLTLVLVVAGIVAGVALFREPLVAFWPPASQLYEIVKLPEAPPPSEEFGLAIANVTFERSREGGQAVLLVGGEISNISETVQEMPRLRVALSDEAGEEIFHWTVTLAASELAAGQQVPFNTRLPNPPANARSLAVTFIVEP